MSQKVRIDGVRHAGASVFLGIDRCGNPCWTRNPERIMVWLCDGWRSRFNQRREQRPHSIPVKNGGTGGITDWIEEPLGGPNILPLMSDGQARTSCLWMAAIPSAILASTNRIENAEWFAGFKDAPKPTKTELKRLKYLQRKMSRQDRTNEARGGRTAKFESKRHQRTLSEFNALQGRIVRRRNDWIEKTTTRLAKTNVLVAMEDLDVQAMTKRPKPRPDPDNPGHWLHNGARVKAGLDRSILNNCWSRVYKRLNDKMAANGGRLVLVPPAYTSQACHKCGHVAKGNRESQAVFHCVKCGYEANADVNAAKNILGRALVKTGGGTALDVEDPHWRPDEASTPSFPQAGSSFGVRSVKGIPRL